MKIFFILLFSIVSLVVLLNSCEYPLKDDYFQDISTRDSANISVSLNGIESGFILEGHKTFTYIASTGELQIIYVNVFIDGQFYKSFPGSTGLFELWSEKHTFGKHQLDIVVATHSGTGSLADCLEAEGFIYTQSWIFNVINPAPEPITITKIFNNNGVLKIEWEKSTDPNFAKYEIFKVIGGGASSFVSFTGQTTTSFEDSTFLGGDVGYYVYVHRNNGYATIGPTKSFSDEPVIISARWIKDCEVELSWPKCKYNKAFSSYNLSDSDGNSWSEITDINTTSVSGDFGRFGKSIQYYLWVNPKGYALGYWSNTELAVGQSFQYFGNFWKNNVNNDILLTNNNILYRYSVSTNHLTDSVSFINYAPYMIYSPSDDVLLNNTPLTKRNPVTLDIIATITGQDNMSLNLSATAWGIARISGNAVLYDYKNMVAVNTLSFNSYNQIRLSDDNNYIFELEQNSILRCYKIEGSSVSLLWWKFIISYLQIPENPDKIVLLKSDGTVEIIQIATNQVINSFPTDAFGLCDVDPALKIIAVGSGNPLDYRIDLYNYENNQKIKSIKATNPYGFIKDGKIFTMGRYMSLSKK